MSTTKAPRYAADDVVQRELDRACARFGGVKSWELTPDGRIIILPPDGWGASSDGFDELAAARARRDANKRQGAG